MPLLVASPTIKAAVHSLLSATHPDTTAAACVRGDLITGQGIAPAWARLALGGAAGSFLRRDATDPGWSTLVLPNAATQGDLLVATGANSIGVLSAGAADRPLIGAGAGTVPAYAGWSLIGTAARTYTFPAVTGTVALGAGTLTVYTLNDVTIASHTHAITSSSNPGAAARILASSASGYLQLVRLGLGMAASYPLDITAAAGAMGYGARIQCSTSTNGAFAYGLGSYITTSNGLGTTVNTSCALDFSATHTGAGTNVYMAGIRAVAAISAGVVQSAYGLTFSFGGNGGSITTAYGLFESFAFSGTAAIGTLYCIRSNAPTVAGGATINTLYGLYLGNMTVGTAVNYSIYTGLGLNRFGDQVSVVGGADRTQLIVTGYTTQTNTVAQLLRNDGATNTANTVLIIGANSTGAPLAGFGVNLDFTLETSTTVDQMAARITALANDPTHATRMFDLVAYAYDTAAREIWRGRGSGTAPMLSFYGGTPVVRGAALTAQLTTITYTAPGPADYAIQDFVDVSLGAGWAFADHQEANTVLSVIANLQARVAELEARLGSATGVNLFA